MQMADRYCKECVFSHGFNDVPNFQQMVCRRFPPAFDGEICDFPSVDDDDWCGEFKAMVTK
jgi:hypothetical protein